MSFAHSESDNWDEAVKGARAIQITLTTPPNQVIDSFQGRTQVEVRVLMDENVGRVFTFHFDDEGKYSSANFKDKYLQKRLLGPEGDTDFALMDAEEAKVKKLE